MFFFFIDSFSLWIYEISDSEILIGLEFMDNCLK